MTWHPLPAGRTLHAFLVAGAAALLPLPGIAAEGGFPSARCAGYSGLPAGSDATAGMVWIPGGSFTMGDDEAWPEERPAHRVAVPGFWIGRHEVTNAQFRRFVAATGYRTVAERGLDPGTRSGLPPELLAPGGMVFRMPERIGEQGDAGPWWRYVRGADWRHPEGPGSSIEGKDNHPVVQVADEDVAAYARWLGRSLPTEAEWEFAARGDAADAAGGGDDPYDPALGWRANGWQGDFPTRDEALDGFGGTAPVGCFPPNGHGLFDMTGNVWEYTRDWFVPGHDAAPATDPQGPPLQLAAQLADPATGPQLVIKGGSWLCAPDFCARARPAARQAQERGLGTNHVGFRTVLHAPPP
jgi:formylglycine-generating enzyme required for sulfatase activity